MQVREDITCWDHPWGCKNWGGGGKHQSQAWVEEQHQIWVLLT